MQSTGFAGTDYLVLVLYLLGVTLLGALFHRGQKNLGDFLVAGRSIAWFPAAISIIATDFSAVSYCGIPAYVFQKDLKLLFTSFSTVIITPVILRIFLPVYARSGVLTAYEYLEKRFDLRVRVLASLLFLLVRGGYIGVVIYAPSIVLSVVTGLPMFTCVLLMGVFTTFYTLLGGMKAVIWTDFAQFAVIVAGLAIITWQVLGGTTGGLGEILSIAEANGRLRTFDFSLDPRVEVTFWGALIGGSFWVLNTYGTDQMILQRYLVTRSEGESRRALITNAILGLPVSLILYFVGILLFVFYLQRPESLAGLPSADGVVPYFAMHHLPHGISGLIIASIFAAAMSTMSSGINSLTTVTVVDFYQRLWRPNESEGHYLSVARWTTAAWGIAATVFALFAKNLGELAVASAKVNSFLGGIPLGIFLLGILTRRAQSLGAIAGALIGTAAVIAVGLFTTVSWMWYAMIGSLVTLSAGYALSTWMVAGPAGNAGIGEPTNKEPS